MRKSNDSHTNIAVNRRQYLTGVGGVGLGISGIQTSQAKSETTEVVIARDTEGPRVTRTVPTAWYTHLQHVLEQAKLLREQLLDVPGVISVGVGNAPNSINSLNKKQIQIHTSEKSIEGKIPDRFNGVTTDIISNVDFEFNSTTKIKGGDFIAVIEENEKDGDQFLGSRACSACMRIYDNGVGPYVLTARHTFTKYGTAGGPIQARDVANDTFEEKHIGDLVSHREDHDAAWFEIKDGVDYEAVPKPNDWVETIEGWVTESGLQTFASGGDTIYFRGKTTGSETYTVNSTGHDVKDSPLTDVVAYDGPDTQDGDSGGIFFWSGGTSDGEAWLCSLCSGTLDLVNKNDKWPGGASGDAMNAAYGLDYT